MNTKDLLHTAFSQRRFHEIPATNTGRRMVSGGREGIKNPEQQPYPGVYLALANEWWHTAELATECIPPTSAYQL